jgi:hypothetical protein
MASLPIAVGAFGPIAMASEAYSDASASAFPAFQALSHAAQLSLTDKKTATAKLIFTVSAPIDSGTLFNSNDDAARAVWQMSFSDNAAYALGFANRIAWDIQGHQHAKRELSIHSNAIGLCITNSRVE